MYYGDMDEEGDNPKNGKALRKPPDGLSFAQRAAKFTAKKTFFITERGFVGSGSQALRPDDSVAIIRGCRIPLVIREHPDADGSFQVVGKCYVGALMDDTFIENVRKKGNLRWERLDFR